MKQILLLLNLLLVLIPIHYTAQTATTISNGNWTSSSTWDCNCMPVSGYSVTINHNVTLDTNIVFTFYSALVINANGSLVQDIVGNRKISIWGGFINNGLVNCAQYKDSLSSINYNNGVFQVNTFISDGQVFENNGTFISDSLIHHENSCFQGIGTVTSDVIINKGLFNTHGQINTGQIINYGNFNHSDGIRSNSLINYGIFDCDYPNGPGPTYFDDSLLISGDLINYGYFHDKIYIRILNDFVNRDSVNNTGGAGRFLLQTAHTNAMDVKNWRNESNFEGFPPYNHVNVSENSVNTGTLDGEFGFTFCDFTPPSSFPFIDINTGMIESSVQWCNTVGLEESKNFTELNIFPNPSRGNFVIKASSNATIIITDELGRVVGKNEVNEANHFTAQITNLESGIYFLISSDKQTRQKIVVSGE